MKPPEIREETFALSLAHYDFPVLYPEETVSEALHKFRKAGSTHKIIYFCVVDRSGHLLGVLPTRLLLTAPIETRVQDIFVPKTIPLPKTATMAEARRAFHKYKFLA